nr:hypothetical protein 1634Bnrm1_p083 [Cryptomonas sp.]
MRKFDMYYRYLFKYISQKYIKHLGKKFQKKKDFFLGIFGIPIKRFYFIPKYIDRDLFFFLWKTRISFISRIFIAGLKFNPIISKKTNIQNIPKFKKNFIINLIHQIKTNQKIIQKNGDILQLVRSFNLNLNIKKKVLKFPIYSIDKELDIIFEETADELKFLLNIKFVKLSLAQSSVLGRCWITFRTSLVKTIKFWKSYITSCYNLMTRFKKIFDLKQHKKELSKLSAKSMYQVLDFSFFDTRQTRKINFTKNIKNSMLFFETEKASISSLNKITDVLDISATRWRNRIIKKPLILKKFNISRKIHKQINFFCLID